MKATMEKLGFAPAWISMIMGLVSSVKFSVLFDDKLESFKLTCGIHQGDPIF